MRTSPPLQLSINPGWRRRTQILRAFLACDGSIRWQRGRQNTKHRAQSPGNRLHPLIGKTLLARSSVLGRQTRLPEETKVSGRIRTIGPGLNGYQFPSATFRCQSMALSDLTCPSVCTGLASTTGDSHVLAFPCSIAARSTSASGSFPPTIAAQSHLE